MVDDIEVFHGPALAAAGVSDPLDLPSSRFFRMAERLPLRGGAVAATFAAVLGRVDAGQPVAAGSPVTAPSSPAALPDISEVIGVSGPNSRGEPWIEYRGGPAA